jgi:hypothetical protein
MSLGPAVFLQLDNVCIHFSGHSAFGKEWLKHIYLDRGQLTVILYLQSPPAECCLLPFHPIFNVMSDNKCLLHIILALKISSISKFWRGITAKFVTNAFVLGRFMLLTAGICSLEHSNELWASRFHRNPKWSGCLSRWAWPLLRECYVLQALRNEYRFGIILCNLECGVLGVQSFCLLRFCDCEQQALDLHSPSLQSLLFSWEFFLYKCSHHHWPTYLLVHFLGRFFFQT